MISKEPVMVKHLPDCRSRVSRSVFLAEVKHLADHSYRPHLIVAVSASAVIEPDTIDLLLECVERMERADGRVSVVADSPEAAVILELTRLTSVLNLFPSMSEAVAGALLPGSGFADQPGAQAFAA